MNDDFVRKVRTAAVAGWWTLLIATGFLVVQWLAYIIIINAHPAWMLDFWGGRQVSWDTIQIVWLWMAANFKVVIWLSLWARGLRESQP